MLLLCCVPIHPCPAFAQPLLNVTNHPIPVNVSPQGANLGQPMVTRPAMMLILKPNHHRRFFSELVIVWVTPCSALWQNYFNSMIFCGVKPKRTTLAPLQQPKKYFFSLFQIWTRWNQRHDSISKMVKKGEIQICPQLWDSVNAHQSLAKIPGAHNSTIPQTRWSVVTQKLSLSLLGKDLRNEVSMYCNVMQLNVISIVMWYIAQKLLREVDFSYCIPYVHCNLM